jgi:hypothetical protein
MRTRLRFLIADPTRRHLMERLVAGWTPSRLAEETKPARRERMAAAAEGAGLETLPAVNA